MLWIVLLAVVVLVIYDRVMPHRRRAWEHARAHDGSRAVLSRAIGWCFRLTAIGLVGVVGVALVVGRPGEDVPTPALVMGLVAGLSLWLGLGLMFWRRITRPVPPA